MSKEIVEVVVEPTKANTKKEVKPRKIKSKSIKKSVDEVIVSESTLYYFYSQGCGWCKRSEPLVDELNNNGHNILKLDLADGDNAALAAEVKEKFSHQCGTPYYVDGDTGNMICGFREKDVIEKWANGEEIPPPPRPTGPAPKAPFYGSSKKEETVWKKKYDGWAVENKHLPNVPKAEEILKRPRPKSDPPARPNPNFTDEQFETWGKEWDKWIEENNHLPNLQPASTMVDNFKQRFTQIQNNPQVAPGPGAVVPTVGSNVNTANLEAKVNSLENKVDRLMRHLGVK